MAETAEKTVKPAFKNDMDIALLKALVQRKVLKPFQADDMLAKLRSNPNLILDEALMGQEKVSEEAILETKAALWNVPYIDLSNYEIEPDVIELIPAKVARQYRCFPLFRINSTLLIAMSDPKNIKTIDAVGQLTRLEVSPALASRNAIDGAINKHYGEQQEISLQMPNDELQGILEVIEAEEGEEEEKTNTQDLERQAEEAPVVRMVNMVLTQAIVDGASDVHYNPEEKQLRVRFRVDGVLRDTFMLPKNLQDAIISRIKILSSLDIAEHRVPQDGQMRLKLKDGRDIDIRVSTLPSAHGENCVLRILDKSAALLNLENLGFEPDVYELTCKILGSAYGIFLVTGPTGSGKTTTLYAALNRLSTVEKNVITLEDPIEYRLPLIRQSQVNHKAGMTFAKGLRAILRQDPDIVMVGEIRDSETANIAVQAALTGHMVLSTLHTNDSAGAVTRLQEMGIESFLISTAVLGVQAQRLVRKICQECKEPYKPPVEIVKDIMHKIGVQESADKLKFYKGAGCKKCRDSGYKGRASIMEVLPITDAIRQLVLKGAAADLIKKTAVQEGMRPLLHDGWLKIMKGMTTIDEVMRVTNVE